MKFKTSAVINIMYIIYWPKQEFIKTVIEWLTFFVFCKKRQTTNELLAAND